MDEVQQLQVMYLRVYLYNGKKYVEGWTLESAGLKGEVYQTIDNFYEVTDEHLKEIIQRVSGNDIECEIEINNMSPDEVTKIAAPKFSNEYSEFEEKVR